MTKKLAINGEKPIRDKMLPYGHQWIDDSDIEEVVKVLKSDWLTGGPKIGEFERALTDYCGAKYAVVVSSGTAALHLSCLVAGINNENEVIASPITFLASANCVLYCGGKPIFVDIEKDTYNINADEIRKKINYKTKAIIPVHFAGLPCDMNAIKGIADEHNLVIIEDACHALGSEWKDSQGKWNRTGSCSHSDMAVFSFHPVKHITTGEGGAILTNNLKLYEKLIMLRSHGITKDFGKFINKDLAFSHNSAQNPWYYEMHELGFNYRSTDIQCALGLSQMKKIVSFVTRRREIVAMYNAAFKDINYIKTPAEQETMRSSWHLYVLQIDFEQIGKSRSSIMNELNKKGIGTQVHYIPVHLQPYYKDKFGYEEGDYPVAEHYYSRTLSLPIYSKMTDDEVARVVHSVRGCLNVR